MIKKVYDSNGHVIVSEVLFDHMVQRITHLEQECRWVPVTERLPDVGVDSLVFNSEDGVNIGCLLDDGRWRIAHNFPSTPTHWMPLSTPPQGEY